MKNPVRNVVVEYKNKRVRKGNSALWGNLDLKSIAREVEADTLQTPMEVPAKSNLSEPPNNKAEINHSIVVPQSATATETIVDERELVVVDAAGPKKAMIASNPVQQPEIAEEIVVRQKKRSARRGVRKAMLQKTKTATRPVATTDIHAELSFLEQENASLKRELIAKLHAENENLFAMLKRVEQRSTTNKR